jgi:3-deoxy-D-manno-octulosonic-acid transferase
LYFYDCMIVLYNLFILIFGAGVRIAALFHPKASAIVTGRKDVFKRLETTFKGNTSPVVWVHCASLGEFEQGRPLIELLRQEYPHLKILLTFFSPSGYEVRKNYNLADLVCYLPADTAANAKRLVSIVNPVFAVFVKYEFWFHFTRALKNKNIAILSISSIFRRNQLFFKAYGGFYRKILNAFSYFFVQNDESLQLLRSIGIQHCTLAGDTRFDRVFQVVKRGEELPLVRNFKNDQKTVVVGSCWPEDLEVLAPFINQNTMKFIIAPHEISEHFIQTIQSTLSVKSIRYSVAQGKEVDEHQVLIIDNIGMLSRLYRYGEFAYVGGGFGKGLHNILEAACYGVPIFFGNKSYQKFQEAIDLINRGGAFEVKDYLDLKLKFELMDMPESFLLACEVTKNYVLENLGATDKIMRYCRTLLK